MRRLLNLSGMFLLLILAAGSSIYVAFQYGPMIAGIYGFLIFMAVLTPWFLTDLLVTWTELFTLIIGAFILIVGISYIPLRDRLVLIVALPIILIIANRMEGLILEKKVLLQFRLLRLRAIMNIMPARLSILMIS